MRILELGTYLAPAYAGMVLAEQGHTVVKWTSLHRDPVERLADGDRLWDWLNGEKTTIVRHARDVTALEPGTFDAVIDNFRVSAWEKWGVDPEEQSARLGVRWVSLRDDFDSRSFDAVAQARAWGDHLGYLPVYLGDTTAGLWLAFKILVSPETGHFTIRQAACLAKLVEGEGVVPAQRDGRVPPWDPPGTYGPVPGGVRIEYRGEMIEEPFRDESWRREHLDHEGGRYRI